MMNFRLLEPILFRSLHYASHSSVSPSEISHFSRLSSLWWDEQGEFALLHKMNPIRMQFIQEKLSESEDHLEGKDVLDVGCGGGLLSEVTIEMVDLWKYAEVVLSRA
jgi:polyprenyldihydroxybenzoate methyltransferase/3-demethylubiquinol 3-O-methyltransferase